MVNSSGIALIVSLTFVGVAIIIVAVIFGLQSYHFKKKKCISPELWGTVPDDAKPRWKKAYQNARKKLFCSKSDEQKALASVQKKQSQS